MRAIRAARAGAARCSRAPLRRRRAEALPPPPARRTAAAHQPLTCPIEGEVADILAHRFTFYGETHDVGADIDWERNPGTAHWSHDLHRFSYMIVLERALRQTARRDGWRARSSR
jgi:hypothetical protein